MKKKTEKMGVAEIQPIRSVWGFLWDGTPINFIATVSSSEDLGRLGEKLGIGKTVPQKMKISYRDDDGKLFWSETHPKVIYLPDKQKVEETDGDLVFHIEMLSFKKPRRYTTKRGREIIEKHKKTS